MATRYFILLDFVKYIDQFIMKEMGEWLTIYTGWRMRIVFVPDDQVDEVPEIIVLDPDMKTK
jgi:hypothetical protein